MSKNICYCFADCHKKSSLRAAYIRFLVYNDNRYTTSAFCWTVLLKGKKKKHLIVSCGTGCIGADVSTTGGCGLGG